VGKQKRQRVVKHTVSIDSAGCRQAVEALANVSADLAPLASVWPQLDRGRRLALLAQYGDLKALAAVCQTFAEMFHADV